MNRGARPKWGAAPAATGTTTVEPGAAPPLPGLVAGRQPTVVFEHVSKWYGDVVAVSDVSFGSRTG
jgi:hypothetical protein